MEENEVQQTNTGEQENDIQFSQNISYFWVDIQGELESCDFPNVSEIRAKFTLYAGIDWNLTTSNKQWFSQLAVREEASKPLVLNMPFHALYQSLNPSGWPQLIAEFEGPDWLGRNIVKGYCTLNVPIHPGKHIRYARIFHPVCSNVLSEFTSWFSGKPAEYISLTRTLGKAEGREVTRVKTKGVVKVVFNISCYGMEKFGYTVKQMDSCF